MSVNAPQSISFDYTSLNVTESSNNTSPTDSSASDSFAVQFMQVQSQMFSSLVSSAFGDNSSDSSQGSSSSTGSSSTDPSSLGLSSSGYNMSLFDPQSGYNMMTTINNDDMDYKAQYADLSQMGTAVQGLQQDATTLGGLTTSTSNTDITNRLNQFVGEYNSWVTKFNGDMGSGGVLAGTQAAQEARYELSQSVQSIFNGAGDGIQGLSGLGLNINPSTGLASLNTSQLNSELSTNKQGVVDTINQFSTNFAKSAELLNESNNFIPSQLTNLSNAISYITNNLSSLQAEFGTGAPAVPTGNIAQALAAYNNMSKT